MPPVKTANPFSFLFLFFLILFAVSCIIILSPLILLFLFVLLFYAIFARDRLIRTNRKFRDSAFATRYFRTRTAPRKENTPPDVVDVGFTVLKDEAPAAENAGEKSDR